MAEIAPCHATDVGMEYRRERDAQERRDRRFEYHCRCGRLMWSLTQIADADARLCFRCLVERTAPERIDAGNAGADYSDAEGGL